MPGLHFPAVCWGEGTLPVAHQTPAGQPLLLYSEDLCSGYFIFTLLIIQPLK